MPTSRSRRKKLGDAGEEEMFLSEEPLEDKRGEFERVQGHIVEKDPRAEEKESNAAQQSTAGRGRGGGRFAAVAAATGRGGRG